MVVRDMPQAASPPALLAPIVEVWEEAVWQAAEAAHRDRLQPVVDARDAVHAQFGKDPVLDFLFSYYSLRPSRLLQWTPPPGVLLVGPAARRFAALEGCVQTADGVRVDPTLVPVRRRRAVVWIQELLERTASRPASYGCHGMHEWAMVYRSDDIRHSQVPLRMEPAALAAFVEQSTVVCSHWDAFRFFTPAARPLNRLQPTREGVVDLEQPGCVHAAMDLYKWAYKMRPWVAAELVADAFLLAVEARRLDMQASPYDLRSQGIEAIPVETEEGRAVYRARQRVISEGGVALRERLIAAYGWIAQHMGDPEEP